MSEPYFRTVLVVEVLTATEAWNGSVQELGEDITVGNASGTVLTRVVETCSEAEIRDLLIAQGSDPEFLIPEIPADQTPYVDGLRTRTDGQQEVETTDEANRLYGCPIDNWCILRAGHDGDCNDDREHAP